jgi:hypothetical protein
MCEGKKTGQASGAKRAARTMELGVITTALNNGSQKSPAKSGAKSGRTQTVDVLYGALCSGGPLLTPIVLSLRNAACVQV